MQKAVIIQSNGTGKYDLENLLRQGWKVVSVTANNSHSYNDFLIILEKKEDDKTEKPEN
ncbi:MAG TPA: hypothetical protein PLT82_06730 [Candidatus Hydrogenedens sp.]|nr:hypothetical protein [Candidatus Hydrogenedens sp.]HOK09104.1 hypothetical protein [Candidatus Hydrogenedens sp.]HOL19170.1 hypothetical protein [Candidatus Hydrogenedens sp.]HPP58812.1 hypothetical protein [Candidatus Hydrogenedens sp.]